MAYTLRDDINEISGNSNATPVTAAMDDYENFYNTAKWVTGLICYPIICVLGIVGNVLIMIVLSRPAMRQATYVFLMALAIADTIKLLNDFLYFLTTFVQHLEPTAGSCLFANLYPWAHFVFNVTVCVASWLTVSVAAERYLLIVHPTSVYKITLNLAVVISIICYIVMILIAIPSFFRYRTVSIETVENGGNITECDVKLTALWHYKQFASVYTWTQSLIRSIVPLFILIALNSCIIHAIRRSRGHQVNSRSRRVTLVLIIVIIFFVCCILPDAIMSAFLDYGYAEDKNFLVKGTREFTDMLLAINASINFILYITFNTVFREEFVKLFCGIQTTAVSSERTTGTTITEPHETICLVVK